MDTMEVLLVDIYSVDVVETGIVMLNHSYKSLCARYLTST